jgi:hypothetical protein
MTSVVRACKPCAGILMAAMAACAPAAVHANAFPLAAGTGRVIATAIYSHNDRAFDNSGQAIDIPDYTEWSVYLQGEYGATDDLTLIATPSFRSVDSNGGYNESGLNFVELGGRYRFLKMGSGGLSVQATYRISGHNRTGNLAQLNDTGDQVDARATLAVPLSNDGRFFLTAEGGYRFRLNQGPDEIHFDLGAGFQATPRLLLLANSFSTISNGGPRATPSYDYHDVYLSGVYKLDERWSLQAGVHGTVAGTNALRQRGVFAGLWFQF